MAEIKTEYDKDHNNWRILRSRDSNHHINTFIAQSDKKLWQMKTELKNPLTPIGSGCCVKCNLNDEIEELMNTGSDMPIHEVYPNKRNLLIALGIGKYSESSIIRLKDILKDDIPGYKSKIEDEMNSDFRKILKDEQLLNHYI
jgi:hypothetical protein